MNEDAFKKMFLDLTEGITNLAQCLYRLQVSLASLQVFVASHVNSADVEGVLQEIRNQEAFARQILPGESLQAIQDMVNALKAGTMGQA